MSKNKKLRSEAMDILFEGMLKLQSVEECYLYFEDLCTVSEMRAMAQRFEVAKKLFDGMTYTQIESSVGVSTATISRVKTALEDGADGYKLVLERMKK